MNIEKPAYEAPSISIVGTLAEITQGNLNGNHTDKQFPADTPRGKLTFS